jgi:hypothetical protein
MLQYSIEGPCCGGGLGITDASNTECSEAPAITVLKGTPSEAKAIGEQAWTETRGGMYMALPRTLCMAGWFKALQRAVNAWIAVNPDSGLKEIQVDARLGPETLAAVQKITNTIGGVSPANVDQLTVNYANYIESISDASGVEVYAAVEPKPHSKNEIKTPVPPDVARDANINIGFWPMYGGYIGWGALIAMGVASAALGYSVYRHRHPKKRAPIYARFSKKQMRQLLRRRAA